MLLSCIAVPTERVHAFSTFTRKSPFSSTGYSKYYNNKDKFYGQCTRDGVDVSEWQDPKYFSYSKAKKDGVDFVITRVTWTGCRNDKFSYKNEDKYWRDHFKKANAAGLRMGIYCFSQAKTEEEAITEANYICEVFEEGMVDLYKNGSDTAAKYLDMPIYMDYEFTGGKEGRLTGIKKATATKCAKAFCETIKARGYKPGIYANTGFLKNTIDGATLGKSYDIWAAQYWKKNEFTGKYTKWQYSSSAKISGLVNSAGKKVNIDVSFWYYKGTVKPQTTYIRKLKGKKKSFYVKWKKRTGIKGYVVQYSRFKDMSNSLKKTFDSYKKYKRTIKTNYRKTNYYVRVRTYKYVGGKKYYSTWSKKKKVYVK